MPRSQIVRLSLAGLAAILSANAQVTLTGRVVDQNEAPVANARVSARRGQQSPVETYSGPSGAFELRLPAADTYLIDVDRTGYFALKDRPVQAPSEITLVINEQEEVFQSVTVGELPSPVDPEQTQREQRLSGTEINDIPYAAAHSLRNSMALIPGVVQDPTGGLHFHGGAEYQTRYTLDGFDISDPIDGRYRTMLAVEGVQSLDLSSARESPENGRASAGTLQVRTDNGTDQLRYTATNFIPGVTTNGGLRVGDWTPRAGISGPIVKGRAWFSDSFNGEYNGGYVTGLPPGENTNPSWVAGNLAHAQVNLTSSNILYADLLVNYDHQAHFGLAPLDPVSTSSGISDHEWLAAVKDQHSWFGGTTLEFGFAAQSVYRRRVPEGTEPYIISPEGRSGNYFVDSRQNGRRDQLFANFFPRVLHFWGKHQLKVGVDAQRLNYSATFQRTGFEIIGLNGLPESSTSFEGNGNFGLPNTVVASYVNDHWQPMEHLTFDLGVREDWDDLVHSARFQPRAALAWAPFPRMRTKITAGYALLTDATDLSLFSRPLDQQAVTTFYSAAGVPQSSVATTFVPGHNLKLPRYDKWSAGLEHDFGHGIAGGAEFLRKRGRDGFVYSPVAGAADAVTVQPQLLSYGFGGTYELTNLRRDSYDEAALTVKQTFGDQYGWMASYVRSRAVSNAVLDPSVDQPLQVQNNFGPVPWDAPNRLLGWGYLPMHWKNWAVAFLVDYRTGFPFSVTDQLGNVVGTVDSHRFPSNFDLNLAVERRFVFRGYRYAIRGGANNLTDHRNPTAVNQVMGAPQFLTFYGNEGRHFVIRIRFFGKVGQ
jgi:Carboxypeptidase regulatory-like domain